MHFSKSKRLISSLAVIAYCVGVLSAPYVKTAFDRYIFDHNVSEIQKKIVESGGSVRDLGRLNEAFAILRDNYYGFNTVSNNDLVSGMISGMVEALGDRHSEYFDLDETKKFNEAISGDFEGIGAVVDESEFGVVVKQILAGSPAKEAGVLSWDIIAKAGGHKLEWLSLGDAIEHIRWPAGTVVELEIFRTWESVPILKEVTRRKITVPSVQGEMVESDGVKIAHVTLSMYGEKTAMEFLKIYAELRSQGAEALILDLRDNGGGLLETAVNVLSNFIERDKVLVTTKERNPFLNRSYFSYGPGDISVPVVVLVNENTASASEITAGALKDYGKAVIVGVNTYGKWSVQQPFPLSDGSEMKITVAKWYTPFDHGIDKVGISPDVVVEFQKQDFENRYDRQLEEAKTVVKKLLKSGRDQVLSEYFQRAQTEKQERKNGGSSSGSLLQNEK